MKSALCVIHWGKYDCTRLFANEKATLEGILSWRENVGGPNALMQVCANLEARWFFPNNCNAAVYFFISAFLNSVYDYLNDW